MIQTMIKMGIDKVATEATANLPEQRYFLLNHPKRTIIEANILKEIRRAELNPRFRLTRSKVEEMIKAGAQFFCQMAINAKIRELMTDAEYKRHESKAGEMKDTQAFLDDMAKEALSTAVSKGMYSGEQVGQESAPDRDRLESRAGDGAANGPDRGNNQSDGSETRIPQ